MTLAKPARPGVTRRLAFFVGRRDILGSVVTASEPGSEPGSRGSTPCSPALDNRGRPRPRQTGTCSWESNAAPTRTQRVQILPSLLREVPHPRPSPEGWGDKRAVPVAERLQAPPCRGGQAGSTPAGHSVSGLVEQRSARHPDMVEVAGSNPAEITAGWTGARCQHGLISRPTWVQIPLPQLPEAAGPWSKGTTPARHAGDPGSTPGGSTERGLGD